MTEIQNKYSHVLGSAQAVLQSFVGTEQLSDKLFRLSQEVRDKEIVIPVIGGFSAGKTSLLNTFMGEEILSVGIAPETSIATELHYAPSAFTEAVKVDGSVARILDADLTSAKNPVASVYHLRKHLPNPRLQEIGPLVLVDMPGFDSSVESHLYAIAEYLDKGLHYIALISSEEGTINRTLLRRLREIQDHGKTFSVYISKTDLRNDRELKHIQEHCQGLLRDYFDQDIPVGLLDGNIQEQFLHSIKLLDLNALIHNAFGSQVRGILEEALQDTSTRLRVSQKDAQSIQNELNKLQDNANEATLALEKKTSEFHDKLNRISIPRLLQDIHLELENSVEECVQAIASGNKQCLHNLVGDIVRSTLISRIQSDLREWAKDLDESLHMTNPEIEHSFSEKLKGFDSLKTTVSLMLDKVLEKLLAKLPPVLKELVQILASTLIESLFASMRKSKLIDALRNDVFPAILAHSRAELPGIMDALTQDIQSQWQQKIQASAQQQKEIMEKELAARKSHHENSQVQVNMLQAAKQEIQTLIQSIA